MTQLLTKQHEIDMLTNFVNNLPKEGYLKSMFTKELVIHIENQIRNDFGFINHKGLSFLQTSTKKECMHCKVPLDDDDTFLCKECIRQDKEYKNGYGYW